jgi:hypothetical protein
VIDTVQVNGSSPFGPTIYPLDSFRADPNRTGELSPKLATVSPLDLHHETATDISLNDRRRCFREIGEADLFEYLIGQTFRQKLC